MSVSAAPHGHEDRRPCGHDHAHPAQDHPPRRQPQTPAASLLRMSALARLGGVAAGLILVWAAVAWAMA